jgi:maleylpyruvate isomerase
MPLTLHGYWRSGAAWRVRIALALKGVGYAQVTHDLRTGAQKDPGFLTRSPQGLVPALDIGEAVLIQSLAILEWLDERYPEPSLLPTGLTARAQVRAMAAAIACDIHPLNNLRVLQSLRSDFKADANQVNEWIARWVMPGFTALEAMITRHGGTFAFGDTPTIADCCLIPQVYSARRFGVDLGAFSRIRGVDTHCAGLAAFFQAQADGQPDADQKSIIRCPVDLASTLPLSTEIDEALRR